MSYLTPQGKPTDDIQEAGEMSEKEYMQRINDKVAEYVASDDDLDDVIINDEATLKAVREFYRTHVNGGDFLNTSISICMNIDSYLINRASKEV